MKNTFRVSFLTLAIVSLLTVQAQAARFWGWEDEVCPDIHTSADGKCYNQVVSTYYVFWIAVNSETSYNEVDCP
jgi:hypothetical protein